MIKTLKYILLALKYILFVSLAIVFWYIIVLGWMGGGCFGFHPLC
jgi:hypothetical protein